MHGRIGSDRIGIDRSAGPGRRTRRAAAAYAPMRTLRPAADPPSVRLRSPIADLSIDLRAHKLRVLPRPAGDEPLLRHCT